MSWQLQSTNKQINRTEKSNVNKVITGKKRKKREDKVKTIIVKAQFLPQVKTNDFFQARPIVADEQYKQSQRSQSRTILVKVLFYLTNLKKKRKEK